MIELQGSLGLLKRWVVVVEINRVYIQQGLGVCYVVSTLEGPNVDPVPSHCLGLHFSSAFVVQCRFQTKRKVYWYVVVSLLLPSFLMFLFLSPSLILATSINMPWVGHKASLVNGHQGARLVKANSQLRKRIAGIIA